MKGEILVDVKISKGTRITPEGKALFQPAAFCKTKDQKSRLHIRINGEDHLIEWDPRAQVL